MTIYTSTHTQTEIDNGVDNTMCYGTSSTGASTAQKSVTVSTGAFSLSAGRKIVVKFSNANTAGTPTLKVGTNAAKNIFNKGSQITTGSNKALIAGVCEFIYDGTQFHLIGSYIDTTYSSQSASSGGTTVSLVTTGEKYTWNNKQASVSKLGSTTKPVYTSAAGTFAECSTYAGGTAVTLNGSSKAGSTASFYAPTSAGTSGYYLKSNGSGAPEWAAFPTIPSKMSDVATISVVAVTSDTSSSCSITGSGNAGKSETIIYTNSSGSDKTVTVPTTYQTPDGAAIELTCPNGGYCEVNYLNIGGTIYARGL